MIYGKFGTQNTKKIWLWICFVGSWSANSLDLQSRIGVGALVDKNYPPVYKSNDGSRPHLLSFWPGPSKSMRSTLESNGDVLVEQLSDRTCSWTCS